LETAALASISLEELTQFFVENKDPTGFTKREPYAEVLLEITNERIHFHFGRV
jgi:hypothetical protein